MAGSRQQHFDFVGLRGESIETNLWARDFTVNAIALELEDGFGDLIDPTGGRADLQASLLRVVYADAFKDDPLRILRALRLRGTLGFSLTSDTEALARSWAPMLERVSPERIRDELVQVLRLDRAAETLSYAADLGVLGVVLPELGPDRPLVDESIRAVSSLERCFGPWAAKKTPASRSEKPPVERILQPLRETSGLVDHWTETLSSGRARWLSLKLAALLSAIPESPHIASKVSRRLHFSKRETRYLAATVRGATWSSIWDAQVDPKPLAIYRYYDALGDAGIDGAALRVAVCLARNDEGSALRACLDRAARLIKAWFEEHSVLIDPPALLTGHDVMEAFSIERGPEIGELLRRVREAQVQGIVKTREEAIAYLRASC
jgi:tRNA nucleotidyltransferase/poly(A) polymerase